MTPGATRGHTGTGTTGRQTPTSPRETDPYMRASAVPDRRAALAKYCRAVSVSSAVPREKDSRKSTHGRRIFSDSCHHQMLRTAYGYQRAKDRSYQGQDLAGGSIPHEPPFSIPPDEIKGPPILGCGIPEGNGGCRPTLPTDPDATPQGSPAVIEACVTCSI
jgi:hypothetical protein